LVIDKEIKELFFELDQSTRIKWHLEFKKIYGKAPEEAEQEWLKWLHGKQG
jgi:hypothetical protein